MKKLLVVAILALTLAAGCGSVEASSTQAIKEVADKSMAVLNSIQVEAKEEPEAEQPKKEPQEGQKPAEQPKEEPEQKPEKPAEQPKDEQKPAEQPKEEAEQKPAEQPKDEQEKKPEPTPEPQPEPEPTPEPTPEPPTEPTIYTWTCPVCGEVLEDGSESHLMDWVVPTHEGEHTFEWSCDFCDATGVGKEAFLAHMAEVHDWEG